MVWFNHLSLLALASPVLTRIDYNPDCKRALRSRGLVKRWQDRMGNLLLQEFSPYTLNFQLTNHEHHPEAGLVSMYPALACLPQDDPQLVNFIRKEYLIPPDNLPYNLSVSLSEFLKKPVPVPNEVDKLVFRGQLKGKVFKEEAWPNDRKKVFGIVDRAWQSYLEKVIYLT